MLVCFMGESGTGKTSAANILKKCLNATVYTGKDYLKMAKNEREAKQLFIDMMNRSLNEDEYLVFIISEMEEAQMIPEKAVRILFTANIETIKERFSKRMKGNLPAPIAAMLERKHGMFDNQKYDLILDSSLQTEEELNKIIINFLKEPTTSN